MLNEGTSRHQTVLHSELITPSLKVICGERRMASVPINNNISLGLPLRSLRSLTTYTLRRCSWSSPALRFVVDSLTRQSVARCRASQWYPVFTRKHARSKHEANAFDIHVHDVCSKFASCLRHVYFMFVSSCKRGMRDSAACWVLMTNSDATSSVTSATA